MRRTGRFLLKPLATASLVVMALILLALANTPCACVRPDLARAATNRAEMKAVASALNAYRLDNGTYPSTRQGLAALVNPPTGEPAARRWQGYLRESPLDPWGAPYRYVSPTTIGGFELTSFGSDGQPGGEGAAAD